MAARQNLTDRTLKALAKKPAKPGTTYDVGTPSSAASGSAFQKQDV